jgi:peptidyl-prolyl cis-trans isomerase B (cyclophilin B)
MRSVISSLLLASASITSAYAAPLTHPSIVEMQTNIGTVTIQLNWDKAPLSSQNFVAYVNSGFYNGTFIHRAVKDFVIQGGGMDAKTMTFKTTRPSILSEANNGLKNMKGTIAMARVADPNSANSQFYFNLKDNANLDKGAALDDKGTLADGYTVFGEAIGGLDIVSKIGNYATIKTGYSEGVPFSEVNDCGYNFCLKKVVIEAVYTSKVVDAINSATRISVSGNGKITSIPNAINCGVGAKACSMLKPFGTAITLNTKPSTGYEFKGWSGDCSGTVTPLVLDTKTKNNNCTATFAKIGA